jgi:hypothetical protein
VVRAMRRYDGSRGMLRVGVTAKLCANTNIRVIESRVMKRVSGECGRQGGEGMGVGVGRQNEKESLPWNLVLLRRCRESLCSQL